MRQITTIHIYVKEICADHFPTYEKARINYTCMFFTECLNLCDVGENWSNTKKPTINLLTEYQYRPNYKLLGKVLGKKCATNRFNEMINQLWKPINSHSRR